LVIYFQLSGLPISTHTGYQQTLLFALEETGCQGTNATTFKALSPNQGRVSWEPFWHDKTWNGF